MTQQPELDFSAKPAAPSAARAEELIAALTGRDWVTARELRALGFTDRELRQLAEHDERARLFSYPGAPGYKLFDSVTVEEFARGIAAIKSQTRLMGRRVIRYLRTWHSLGRRTP